MISSLHHDRASTPPRGAWQRTDVATLNIAAVSITTLARLVIGPMCDRYGPRKVYVALMIAGMLPMLGAALAPTYHTFFWCRLAIGAVGDCLSGHGCSLR